MPHATPSTQQGSLTKDFTIRACLLAHVLTYLERELLRPLLQHRHTLLLPLHLLLHLAGDDLVRSSDQPQSVILAHRLLLLLLCEGQRSARILLPL